MLNVHQYYTPAELAGERAMTANAWRAERKAAHEKHLSMINAAANDLPWKKADDFFTRLLGALSVHVSTETLAGAIDTARASVLSGVE